ncbi:MAG: DUF4268 domain-containing protein [Roseivirga sp.]|uniref:DUF4268 domain-containing protein n=1 Tax=Roseivirga sp. TaxID=1964215 RepID=UPI001B1EF1C7|nr:DUF4268 domain-containing protein [Roseivirga sp.]MBO6659342.1 DUF4268 domain-containing protein [Roseivirga sp.]MBO6761828.1 DUF4268 domain-containing protein [Roseivirga sp.]MBO6907921.1 DUF4268 domain-containing protein [Roseivirga sp.]
MYQIDKASNNIIKLEECQFSQLGFKERDHLQEWIAKNPDVLGEELLIIQKEFSGFNDTNERLDLLAIDKQGGLVIIENKLDDSGKDLVWQALKYTSYCSTLTTKQIIKFFQEYLNKYVGEGDALEILLDFLESDEDDLVLNHIDQRLMFVANDFRKEVTSTVLWLLKHSIQIQCFRARPYRLNESLFLQVEQIIPVPETKEFIIDAQEKEREDKEKSKIATKKQALWQEFWSHLKRTLQDENVDYLNNVSAGPYSYIGFTKGAGTFYYCIGRAFDRVELYMSNDSEKRFFDSLVKYKDQINAQLDGVVTWERRDGGRASKVKLEMTKEENKELSRKIEDSDTWEPRLTWFVDAMNQFYTVIYPFWERAQKEVE